MSPGDNGFSAEFYKTFDPIIAKPLADMFNTILTSGSFPHFLECGDNNSDTQKRSRCPEPQIISPDFAP